MNIKEISEQILKQIQDVKPFPINHPFLRKEGKIFALCELDKICNIPKKDFLELIDSPEMATLLKNKGIVYVMTQIIKNGKYVYEFIDSDSFDSTHKENIIEG